MLQTHALVMSVPFGGFGATRTISAAAVRICSGSLPGPTVFKFVADFALPIEPSDLAIAGGIERGL